MEFWPSIFIEYFQQFKNILKKFKIIHITPTFSKNGMREKTFVFVKLRSNFA